MTPLLQQAFDKAAPFPAALQDHLASALLDDIAGELQGDTTLAHAEDLLAKRATPALQDFEAEKKHRHPRRPEQQP